MDLFATTNRVVRSAVLFDGGVALSVVSAVDVGGEYANGEYAFGLTLAKVWGNQSVGAEEFYLASGDLPNGDMFSGVFSHYMVHEEGVKIFVHASYDWTNNTCTQHSPLHCLWLPPLCSQALAQLSCVDPRAAHTDEAFDMDVVALLEDCGFWPWNFHFADPNTNFVD